MPELTGVHTAVLGLSVIEGGCADPVLPPHVGHFRSHLMLLQHVNDLQLGEMDLRID